MLVNPPCVAQKPATRTIRQPGLIMHYACEGFLDPPPASYRVCCISALHVATGHYDTFSVDQVAEKRRRRLDSDCLFRASEKEILTQMYRFLRDWLGEAPAATILHWSMKSASYGFPALCHRAEVLRVREAFPVPTARLFDLAWHLEERLGELYVPHKRLDSLIRLNGIDTYGYLTGAEQAQAFENGEFGRIRQSVERKVQIIHQIFKKYRAGQLFISPGDGGQLDAHGEFAEARKFAREKLKGIQRRVLELLCQNGGAVPIADLAADPQIGWSAPFDNSYNNVRKTLNEKFAKSSLPYQLLRKGSSAVLLVRGDPGQK
jgi:hypothetical protein